MTLFAALDEPGIEPLLPAGGLIEIAAVATRLSNSHDSGEICNEVETSYTLVPEDRIIRTAKIIAIKEGFFSFDTRFLALAGQQPVPLFTDEVGMVRICQRRSVTAWLIRDLNLKSHFSLTGQCRLSPPDEGSPSDYLPEIYAGR